MKTQRAQFHIKRQKGIPYLYVEKFVWDSKLNRNRLVISRYVGNAEKLFSMMDGKQFQEGTTESARSFEFGKSAALLSMAEELTLPEIFSNIFGATEGETILQKMMLMVLGRFNPGPRPRSKLNTASWYWKDSFLPFIWELEIPKEYKAFANDLYECMDEFTPEKQDAIWTRVAHRLIDLGRRPTRLILDGSNIATWITQEHGEIPRKGWSKEKRYDLNLVGFHAAVDSDGIPFFGGVHPGNTSDADLFRDMVDKMATRLSELNIQPEETSLIIDKGNNSEDGLNDAWKKGFHIIGTIKRNQKEELLDIPLEKHARLEFEKDNPIYTYRATEIQYGKECSLVVVYNPRTQKKEELDYIKAKTSFIALCKDLDKKIIRVGRGKKLTPSGAYKLMVKSVYPKYEGVFKGEVDKNGDFLWWIDKDHEKKLMKGFGKQILFTDLNGMATKDIVEAYLSRNVIEHEFSECKKLIVIPIGPVWHYEDRRIRAHIFLCLLGMLMFRYMLVKLAPLKMTELEILSELGRLRLGYGIREGKMDFLLENYGRTSREINKLIDFDRFIPNAGS
jgi:transposase